MDFEEIERIHSQRTVLRGKLVTNGIVLNGHCSPDLIPNVLNDSDRLEKALIDSKLQVASLTGEIRGILSGLATLHPEDITEEYKERILKHLYKYSHVD